MLSLIKLKLKVEAESEQIQIEPDFDINKIPDKTINDEYFDEFGNPRYEAVVNFENQLRAEVELNSALISDRIDIATLIPEFENTQFEKSIRDITKKYKAIRTVRRDGNCFYRAYMFRIFEELAQKKNNKLYVQIIRIVEESKNLYTKNGLWLVIEDFYEMFVSEWKFVDQLELSNAPRIHVKYYFYF